VVSKPSADARFRKVFEETHADVLAYCLRRAPLEDAKDATADVFLVLWRRLEDLSAEDLALPWLYGTARKILANQRRTRVRQTRLSTRMRWNLPETPIDPETVIVRREQDQEVLDALARLRPAEQEVIQLTMWEELPQAAIGEILHCSDRAVTMRLHRAMRRLGHHLQQEARFPTDAFLAPTTEAIDD